MRPIAKMASLGDDNSDADTDTDTNTSAFADVSVDVSAQRAPLIAAHITPAHKALLKQYDIWRVYLKILLKHPFHRPALVRWQSSAIAHSLALTCAYLEYDIATIGSFHRAFMRVLQRIVNAIQCIGEYQQLKSDAVFIRAKLHVVRRHMRSLRSFIV